MLESDRAVRARILVVSGLYFASGVTGLVYEVVFSKYLSYVFGVSAYASSAVLVAFMGGLAAGGWLVARWDARLPKRLIAYGIAEIAVGACACLTPWLLAAISGLYLWLARSVPASLPALIGLRWLLATAVVFLPAVAMGATFPLLAPWLGAGAPPGWLSRLYGLNVMGGALGALGAAYLVVPALGLGGTLRASVLTNVAIGAIAIALDGGPRRAAVTSSMVGS